MNLTARERRILKLARSWEKARVKRIHFGEVNPMVSMGVVNVCIARQRKTCGKAILNLFPKAALKIK